MRRLDGLLVLLVLLVFLVLLLSILSLLIRLLVDVAGPLQPSSLAKTLTLTLSDECLVRVRDRVYR